MSLNLTTLNDPKAFDTLRQDDAVFEQVSCLAELDTPTHLQLCRYAQYLFYRERDDEAALVLKNAAKLGSSALHRALVLMQLVLTDQHIDLRHRVASFRATSAAPLDLEAYALGFELCAFYYAAVEENYARAHTYLTKAEGFAEVLKLDYRLISVRAKLSSLAAMSGDATPSHELTSSESGLAHEHALRARYLLHLSRNDIVALEQMLKREQICAKDLNLARATKLFARHLAGEASLSRAADLITEHIPDHPEAKLFWCFLMLQLFSVMGAAGGRVHPRRVQEVLQRTLSELDHPVGSAAAAAKIYPLGLSLAAAIEPGLAKAVPSRAIIRNDSSRDGIHKGDERVLVTKQVRHALILDEYHAVSNHFKDVTTRPHGHPTNRTRWEASLAKAQLRRDQLVTVGGLARGFGKLSEALKHPELARRSFELTQQLNVKPISI